MQVFHDEDADLSILKGKTISVIGYGSQGRAQSNNMRDSGLNVVIGAGPKDLYQDWSAAEKDGFRVLSIEESARIGDIVHILLPDPIQPEIYQKQIHNNLRKDVTLSFSTGFNITYGFIKPPEEVDVIAVVPETPGQILRELFLNGQGFFGTIAVEHDHSGSARQTALAMAKSIGLTRVGVIETTFRKETEIDNFVEQACIGGMIALFQVCYEVLVEAGHPPIQAYLKVVQEQQVLMDALCRRGFEYTWSVVSDTCEFAGRTRGRRVIGKDVVKTILEETQRGEFAKDWLKEFQTGMKRITALQKAGKDSELERVGREVRALTGIE